MRLHIIAESRKEAVNTIAAALGEEVKYQGAPSLVGSAMEGWICPVLAILQHWF